MLILRLVHNHNLVETRLLQVDVAIVALARFTAGAAGAAARHKDGDEDGDKAHDSSHGYHYTCNTVCVNMVCAVAQSCKVV